MKKFKHLCSSDFQGIDPIKFNEWHKSGITIRRYIILVIIFLLFIHLQLHNRLPSNLPSQVFLLGLWSLLMFLPYRYYKLSNELGIIDNRPVKIVRITIKIIKWIFGIGLVSFVIDSFKYGNVTSSILWTLAGLSLLPPISKIFQNRFGVKKKKLILYPTIIALIILASFIDKEYKKEFFIKKYANWKAHTNINESIIDKQRIDQINSDLKVHPNVLTPENNLYTIENEFIKLGISQKGGRPYSVEFKKYSNYNSMPVILFDGDSTRFGLIFLSQEKSVIHTNELYFIQSVIEMDGIETLIMRVNTNESGFIEYRYSLKSNSYVVDLEIEINGLKKIETRYTGVIDLEWDIIVPQQEIDRDIELNQTTIYYNIGDDIEHLHARSIKLIQTIDLPYRVKWIAYKGQFFSSILMADNDFLASEIKMTALPSESIYLKKMTSIIGIPIDNLEKQLISLHFYFGPNRSNIMKEYGKNIEKIIPHNQGLFLLR